MRTQPRAVAFQKVNKIVRTTLRAALICALGVCGIAATPSYARAADINGTSYKFDISGQTLPQALRNYAQVSGQEIIFTENLFEGTKLVTLKGAYTAADALDRLLKGTGLKYERSPSGAIMIRKAGEGFTRNTNNSPLHVRGEGSGGEDSLQLADNKSQSGSTESDSSSRARETNSPQDNRGVRKVDENGKDRNDRETLEEIVVTAQKREERLQDVPVPVSAIAADNLVKQNLLRLQEYYMRIPGLTVAPIINGPTSTLAIRGITTGAGTNPTVGITVDDVPYGASANIGGGNLVPSIDPSELTRVEVLRGPQGTLYGASSMGGLLKFVTRDPSMERLSGHLQAGVNSVHNGDDLGYNMRGALNMPLGDLAALSVSGFHRRDPGYVDDIGLGIEGVNQVDVDGGRVATFWRPSDAFSLKLSALLQRSKGDGSAESDIALPDLQHARLPGTQWSDDKVQAYNATVAAKLGNLDLIAVSGYNINSTSNSFDAFSLYAALMQPLFGVTGAEIINDNKTDKFTQELRLSMPLGQHVEWLFGAFYTKEDSSYLQRKLPR